ncbi:uncharacterized protein PRCAT00000266001 [Priceomyces carsonii]|uniref:uncharacterized protein n=1 Tax=Priceomyces carsonii TaxID=28549 RepID=UPI002EDB6CF5|nr:unnamed protein product [Priceomyces carsonii]
MKSEPGVKKDLYKTEVNDETKGHQDEVTSDKNSIQFRIFVGSYEHNLLCLSLIMDPSYKKEAIFQPIFHFQAHSLSIRSIDVAKRYLVTGSNDEHIRIYDLQKRKELGALLSHQGSITILRFSREGNDENSLEGTGKWLLSGSEDGKIIIWRRKDWETFGILKGHQGRVNDLDIHPSGRVCVSVGQDHTIRLWNLMTAKKAAAIKVKGKDHLGKSLEFVRWTLDGNFFIVGLKDQLWVYETKSAKIFKKILIKSLLMCMKVFKVEDYEWLVTGHSDGQIHFTNLHSVTEGEADVDNSRHFEPTYSLRGHINRVKDLTLYRHQVKDVEYPLLISVSSDGRIVVWNIANEVRDQVAVYDSGERLNCVAACPESIEKSSTMKRHFTDVGAFSESEYETDAEEIQRAPKSKKKGNKGKKKVKVTLE